MKEETKKRIDAIRRGEVPENYVRTEYGVFPDHWRFAELREIAQPITETAGARKIETVSISAGVGFVNQAEKFGKELSGKQYEKYTVLHQGDFSYNKGNSNQYPQGCIYRLNDREVAAVPNVFESFRIVEGDPDYYEHLFLSGFLNHQLFRKINHGIRDDGLLNLTEKDFYSCVLPVPPIEEQHEIARILSSCDQNICLRQKALSEMKRMKRTLLSKLFPNAGNLYPELRFHSFTDTWEQRKLGDVCERVQGNDGRMDLPTLTISAANGWMSQEDRFSGNIAGKEQKYYTLLHKGELSYNHGNSKLAKYGTVFSLETYEEALVPRVYHSFRMTNGDANFIEYYFATKLPDRELAKLISSGARMNGLLNIGFDEFMGIKISLTSLAEQKRISVFLRSIDSLIALHQREVELHQNKKKALMQLLLIGHVSVS